MLGLIVPRVAVWGVCVGVVCVSVYVCVYARLCVCESSFWALSTWASLS